MGGFYQNCIICVNQGIYVFQKFGLRFIIVHVHFRIHFHCSPGDVLCKGANADQFVYAGIDVYKRQSQLFETIRLNMPAFERARASVAKPLEKQLKRLAKYENNGFLKLVNTCGDNPIVYPTLVFPMLQMVLYSYCYEGILNEELEKNESASISIKEEVIRQSKALADKSKLDILCSLKESSKYNLELAEALDLSPSTTSHHMSILMGSGLVTVQKKDGKVYYCLQEENIEKYIQSLKKLLL